MLPVFCFVLFYVMLCYVIVAFSFKRTFGHFHVVIKSFELIITAVTKNSQLGYRL